MNPKTNKFEQLHTAEDDAKGKAQAEEKIGDLKRQLEAAARGDLAVFDGGTLEKNTTLLRPDGTPVPKHWTIFAIGEHVVIKNYTFRVAYYNETSILFEPVGPVVVGEKDQNDAETT